MTINVKSVIPYYFQIKADIVRKITTGELKENEKLTPETILAEHYHVSRPTVRQALNELVYAGYIWRKQGKGTFVSPLRIHENLLFYKPFAEEAEEIGKKPGLRVLSEKIVKATPEVALSLNIETDSDTIELVGLRLADNEPILIRTSYYPVNLFPKLFEELAQGVPIIEIVERNGVYPARAVQNFQVVPSRTAEGKHLGVPKGTPLILWEGVLYTDDDRPYELTRAFHRSDKYVFHIEQQRDRIIGSRLTNGPNSTPSSLRSPQSQRNR